MIDDEKEEEYYPSFLPARYIFAFLANLGMAIVYGLRVSLNVTMVVMVNHSAALHVSPSAPTNKDRGCHPPSDTSPNAKVENGIFNWSESLQSNLLSCYFWGYMVSQIPSARIAEIYSAKWVFLSAVAINFICTIFSPVLAKFHYAGLMAMRILKGVGGGAAFPSMHNMIASWAPQTERLLIATLIYVGTSAGTATSILLSNLIFNQIDWEAVFYITGGLSIIWMILWVFLIQDNPNKQRLMTAKERDMINASLGEAPAAPYVPWCKIFKSGAFWAILIAHTCSNFGWYIFVIEIPSYIKQVLKFNVSKCAALSALPFILMPIFSIVLSKVLDILQNKNKIRRVTARKIATGISSVVPALCLCGMCFVRCRHYVAISLMCLGIVGAGGMFCGFLSNHMDISPHFAGTLMALTNTIATIPGIAVPSLVGFITDNFQTIQAWRVIFGITIGLYIIEFVIYMLLAQGEVQPWDEG
ncbi:hypothetical protein AWZ03_007033 [Drosophila navojoa]|uniref:Major facilitator superfamily (MFS) profile domain-containing protein n=1 Tax=Drosophila navojoa TaxID=7232 RepID=A0A484BFN5_DRONA|nr:sialin-like [Drosophila navojoa]TDG46595.1 hypothetical protein AWZ03_007033 [Drosophila navojoa]